MTGDGGLWLAGVCLFFVGCGTANDGASAPPGGGGLGGTAATSGAGTGGTGVTGGVTSASGGTAGIGGGTSAGGASVSDQSPRSACRAYIDAVCRRRAVCNGRSPDETCAGYGDDYPCPDYFFSAGSAHTPAQMLDCAKQLATLSCGIALQGTPPCSTPGTRAPGEKCLYGSQCSTLGCSVSFRGGVCGTCLPFLPPGAPCNVRDGVCPVDLVCLGGTCQQAPDVAPITIPGPGMPCTNSCTAGYACSAGKTCAPLPSAGQPCSLLTDCSSDTYCAKDKVCTPRPGAGAACVVDVNNNPQCATNTDCAGNVCTARAPLGAPCGRPGSGTSLCVTGATCMETATAGSFLCRTLRETGESCTNPNDACAPGTACTGGKCVTTGANAGIYDQVCGP
jgi:hypothetical protein